ncbi:hypothetical protein LSH36_606g01053, partial [Paralvinella palmiformis]
SYYSSCCHNNNNYKLFHCVHFNYQQTDKVYGREEPRTVTHLDTSTPESTAELIKVVHKHDDAVYPTVLVHTGRSESEVSGTGRDSEHLPSEGDEKPSIINPGILESENVKPETTIDTITTSSRFGQDSRSLPSQANKTASDSNPENVRSEKIKSGSTFEASVASTESEKSRTGLDSASLPPQGNKVPSRSDPVKLESDKPKSGLILQTTDVSCLCST